jgi:hypothetical protein
MYKDPPVKCINSFVLIIFFAAISIFHDVVILVLPLPILWGLKLQWKKKAHAMFMFSVGVFVIICSPPSETPDPTGNEAYYGPIM